MRPCSASPWEVLGPGRGRANCVFFRKRPWPGESAAEEHVSMRGTSRYGTAWFAEKLTGVGPWGSMASIVDFIRCSRSSAAAKHFS